MLLTLQNGYPFPYPADLTEDQQETLSELASENTLVLSGVSSIQWLHTFTVRFTDSASYTAAKKATQWEGFGDLVLEAPTSVSDGYGHPAIIAEDRAYCGFFLSGK